jgi:pilus assembly protein CpaE
MSAMAVTNASKDPETPADRPADRRSLLAFVTDEHSRAVLAQAAQELRLDDAQIGIGTAAEAVRVLALMTTPQRILIDLSGGADPLSDVGALAEVCDDGTQVIVIGEVNDVDLYRKLIASGVDDYFVKPIALTTATAALRQLDRAFTAASSLAERSQKPGRIVAVIGARGGVGATTVAVNVAWLMAHEINMRTALVDLDLYFGTCALALDMEAGRGFREALESPERIDGLFIERAMARESEHLFVLAAEDDIETSRAVDPAALALLIDHLQRDFHCIVFDLPRFAARTQVALLPKPLSIVLVSDPTIAGMRDTLRLGKALRNSAPAADFFMVLNRCGAVKGGELDRKDFEHDADVTINCMIPFDVKPAAMSAGAGKPLAKVAPRSRAAQSLKQLTQHLSGVEAPDRPRGRLMQFLKPSR